MSPENLEIVRLIYGAWQAGDFTSIEWADPAIEYEVADGPSMDRGTGLARMAEIQRDFMSAWEEWRVEAVRSGRRERRCSSSRTKRS